MSATETMTDPQRDQIIADCIQDERQVVVTHRTPSGWRQYKASFASSDTGRHLCLHVWTPPGASKAAADYPHPGDVLGITFRLGHKKCMLNSVLESIGHRDDVMSFQLTWPLDMRRLQRRIFERVAPPSGTVIAVRFWLPSEEPSAPPAERVVRHGQMEDVSAGGIRIKVANADDLEIGRSYRCVFAVRPGAPPFLLDGLLRHKGTTDQGRFSLGFQLVGLETSEEGRRTLDRLARLISQFQRARNRKRR